MMSRMLLAVVATLLIACAAADNHSAEAPDRAHQAQTLLSDFTHLSTQLPANWNASTPLAPCDWTGIKCSDDNSTVTELRLSNRSVAGRLPPSWSHDLPRLTTISLEANHLTGPLPAAWSELTDLTAVMLGGNHLNSTLPAQWSTIGSLRYLSLPSNALTGTLPAAWSAIEGLNTLYAEDNLLQGSVPDEWRKLGDLSHLHLDRNAAMCGNAAWLGEQDLQLTANGTGIGSPCPSPPPSLSSADSPPPSPLLDLSPPPPPPPPIRHPDATPGNVFIWVLILLAAAGSAVGYMVWSTCQSACGPFLDAWAWVKAKAGTVGWRVWGYQQLHAKSGTEGRAEEVELGRAR